MMMEYIKGYKIWNFHKGCNCWDALNPKGNKWEILCKEVDVEGCVVQRISRMRGRRRLLFKIIDDSEKRCVVWEGDDSLKRCPRVRDYRFDDVSHLEHGNFITLTS